MRKKARVEMRDIYSSASASGWYTVTLANARLWRASFAFHCLLFWPACVYCCSPFVKPKRWAPDFLFVPKNVKNHHIKLLFKSTQKYIDQKRNLLWVCSDFETSVVTDSRCSIAHPLLLQLLLFHFYCLFLSFSLSLIAPLLTYLLRLFPGKKSFHFPD